MLLNQSDANADAMEEASELAWVKALTREIGRGYCLPLAFNPSPGSSNA